MADDHRSPFYAIQESMGATFVPEGGWLWTDSFGDTDAEYRAPRERRHVGPRALEQVGVHRE